VRHGRPEQRGHRRPRGGDDRYRGNYRRLVDVKGSYDLGNLFRMNQNIKPKG
jgi:Berberine and berberine like